MVTVLNLSNRKEITRANDKRPAIQPSPNTMMTGMSTVRRALSMYYLLISNRMKEPEMPGSIMAQMATAPAMKINHRPSGD